jgi:sugar O-acyltransferase (sialic acid O-acetyltransferase NeuD family)
MKIMIVGSSGFSKVVIDIVEKEGRHTIHGLIDSFRPVGEETLGYTILGTEKELPGLMEKQGVEGVLIAIGDNGARFSVYEKIFALCPGMKYPTAVHPSAQIARDVDLGEGTVVAAVANIHNGTRIGRFCIINGHSQLGHDVHVGDFASVGPDAAVAGNVTIGELTAVAIGSHILEKRSIGSDSIVGAGSLVTKDVPDNVVVYGSPAKVVKERCRNDKYLS